MLRGKEKTATAGMRSVSAVPYTISEDDMSSEKEKRNLQIKLLGDVLAGRENDIKAEEQEDDIQALLECMEVLKDSGEAGGFLPIMNFRNNRTAFRLMVPIMGVKGINAFVSGIGPLSKEPFNDMIEAMSANGCEFRFDHFPFELIGTLKGGDYSFGEDACVDLISGLLMALPMAEGDSRIAAAGAENKSEIMDTIEILKEFGIDIDVKSDELTIKGGQKYI